MNASCRPVERRPFDLEAVDRIGTIEHDHRDLALGRLLHHVRHRRHVGVEARADVLQVDDERVEPVEHGGGRPPRIAVERVDGQTRSFRPSRTGHVRVEHAADAVLRAEQRDQRHVLRAVQQIDRRRAVARAAGVIGEQSDALAAQRARTRRPRSTSMPVSTAAAGAAPASVPDGAEVTHRSTPTVARAVSRQRRSSPTPRRLRCARAAA